MAYAIAESFAQRGCEVILISGPVKIKANHENIRTIPVTSASEMLDATNQIFKQSDISVFCAAVADYTPSQVSPQKVKRNSPTYSIELKATKDIAATMGAVKSENQFNVGFALETQNEKTNAIGKLKKKNLDLIVLNSLNDKGAGFNTDTNKVTLIDKDENINELPLLSKSEVAEAIVESVIDKFGNS